MADEMASAAPETGGYGSRRGQVRVLRIRSWRGSRVLDDGTGFDPARLTAL